MFVREVSEIWMNDDFYTEKNCKRIIKLLQKRSQCLLSRSRKKLDE